MQVRTFCDKPEDCAGPGDKACLLPSLDNSSRLLRIIRSGDTDVLYVGDPRLLHYTVMITNFSPRSPFIPLELPTIIETFL
ncbi:hypothetical protein QZH41_015836, partial [Actinostola sp. cb2023]